MMNEVRDLSTKIFGNEKVVEVVVALAREGGIATAQVISKRTGVDHPMVRTVARRLVDAGVLRELPRASRRGELYYEVAAESVLWRPLVDLALAVEAMTHEQPANDGPASGTS